MSLIFGRLGQSFVDFGTTMASGNPSPEQYQQASDNLKSEASRLALWLVVIGQSSSLLFTILPPSLSSHAHFFLKGIGTWFTTYVYMATWAITGERNAKRIRENYLRAILRQDVAYFDTSGGAGEVATRIQSDTRK